MWEAPSPVITQLRAQSSDPAVPATVGLTWASTSVEPSNRETNTVAMQLYDKLAERSGFVVYRKLI